MNGTFGIRLVIGLECGPMGKFPAHLVEEIYDLQDTLDAPSS